MVSRILAAFTAFSILGASVASAQVPALNEDFFPLGPALGQVEYGSTQAVIYRSLRTYGASAVAVVRCAPVFVYSIEALEAGKSSRIQLVMDPVDYLATARKKAATILGDNDVEAMSFEIKQLDIIAIGRDSSRKEIARQTLTRGEWRNRGEEIILDVPVEQVHAIQVEYQYDVVRGSSRSSSYTLALKDNVKLSRETDRDVEGKLPEPLYITSQQAIQLVRNSQIDVDIQVIGGPDEDQSEINARRDAIKRDPQDFVNLLVANQAQDVAWSEGIRKIATFDLPEDVSINKLSELITKVEQEAEKSEKSGKSGGFGFKGISANMSLSKESEEKLLNREEFKWLGTATAPPSLKLISVGSFAGGKSLRFTDTTSRMGMRVSEKGAATALRVNSDSSAASWLSTPVGTVLPVYLTAEEVGRLAPTWLPADGRAIPENSPLYKQGTSNLLPDIRQRVVVGATTPQLDRDRYARTSESILDFYGETEGVKVTEKLGSVEENTDYSAFAVDTLEDETKRARHSHNVHIKQSLPLPPHQELFYIIRVLP